MKKIVFILVVVYVLKPLEVIAQQDILEGWTYIQIDSTKQMWGNWAEPEWLRYFGLDAGDVDRDGNLDIISGRYVYHNPGGAMERVWKRTVLDDNVDAILTLDVDGDPYADIIAMALPNIYWYEAIDEDGTKYKRKKIGEVPATSHVNSQGFEKAQILEGGFSEFVIAGNGNIYAVEIPATEPHTVQWNIKLICKNTSDEGIGIGDIDGDGDIDIAAGRRPEGEEEPKILAWFENPGHISRSWEETIVGNSEHPIDRIEISDVDGDKKSDIIVTEERYPGLEPDANFWWFGQKGLADWERNKIVTQFSINNLDVTDFDKDGDVDLLTAEHKGQQLELQLWKNDGAGNFSKQIIDTGKENHLGTQFVDLDSDGDLDIIGAGWDQHQYMHVWRNDAIRSLKAGMLFKDHTWIPDLVSDKGRFLRVGGKLDYTINERHFPTDSNITATDGTYENRLHYIINTKNITYYYDIAGGGFSRIIDRYGNDWVSYKTEPWNTYPASAASSFRGLPNLVFGSDDGGAGHPGHDKCVSELVEWNKIRTKTHSEDWAWEWTFYDDHAVLEVLKTPANAPYWFLYEGTPGGKYDTESSIYGTDLSGPNSDNPDFFKGDILWGNFRWAYFGKGGVGSTFFVIQKEIDEQVDMMSYLGSSPAGNGSEDGMTVFGFGRGENTKPLIQGTNTFIIGMVDYTIENKKEHQRLSEHIENLLKK